jgi:hypothetical protein
MDSALCVNVDPPQQSIIVTNLGACVRSSANNATRHSASSMMMLNF